jgi:hypothetical protein
MQKRLNRHSLLKVGVVMLVLVVPLYPKFPFLRIPGSQVSLRLEDFLLAAVSLVWLGNVLPKWRALMKDRIIRAVFLFWAVGLVSLLSAILVTQTVVWYIGLFHWVRRVEYMVVLFIGMEAVKAREDLVVYVKCLLIVIVYAFVFAVGQKYFNWPVITTQNWEYAKGIALRYVDGGHLIATFAGHYDLATFLILVLPIFLSVLLASGRSLSELGLSKNKWLGRMGLVVIIGMGMWLLVNAASRISIASYLGAMTVALVLVRRYKVVPIVVVVTILFVGLSSNLIDRYTRIIKVTLDKVVQVINVEEVVMAAEGVPQRRESESTPTPAAAPIFEDRSTSIRLNVEWPRAGRALKKNPLLGTGYSSITLATDNDYLRMIGEVGILGTLAFGLVGARILMEIIRYFPLRKVVGFEGAFVAGMVGSLAGVGLNMVFIDILEASKFAVMFWLMMGMTVALVRINKND